MKFSWKIWLPVLIIIICTFSCLQDKNSLESGTNYNYSIPIQTNDGWETASLSSVGMNTGPLINLVKRLIAIGEHRVHSLLIIKDGKLVFEEYFPGEKFNLAQPTGETGFDMNDTHNLCSATKSFTSALVGIAIDKGYIQSVDQGIFEFFSDYIDILNVTPDKANITLEHLLTMTSGLAWDDESYSYFDPRNDLYQLFRSSDPIRYILSRQLIEVPGTYFAYRNCNTNLLGEIIHITTDERIDDFSANYLFSILGISDFEWQLLPNGVVFASGDLRLRPRDMAKFGLLFLNQGIWNDERIISGTWIDQSTHKYNELSQYWVDLDGYGYQWWLWENIDDIPFCAYAASGWGGQWIIVVPDANMVFVTTGGNYYTNEAISIESILKNYIIPSL